METQKSALVLGATGGIGGAIASALLRHGWQVRGMARRPQAVHGGTSIEWVTGDAMQRDDVVRAAQGVSLIVHAVNPPNYSNWDKLVLPMMDNTIAAARAAGGARILLPGTIYNFDPAQTPLVTATSPQQPKSRKGLIRVALEQRLEQAAPDVPSVILRAGDFFGPGVRASWFAQAMVAPGKPVERVVNVAQGGGHSWAYLPDLAETAARLVDMPKRLQAFERVQFEGYFDQTGTGLIEAVNRVVGRKLPVRRFPWWLMQILAPFGGFPREAADIAAFWRHPVKFDNTRLVQILGDEPRTGLDVALAATLADMGALPGYLGVNAGQVALAH